MVITTTPQAIAEFCFVLMAHLYVLPKDKCQNLLASASLNIHPQGTIRPIPELALGDCSTDHAFKQHLAYIADKYIRNYDVSGVEKFFNDVGLENLSKTIRAGDAVELEMPFDELDVSERSVLNLALEAMYLLPVLNSPKGELYDEKNLVARVGQNKVNWLVKDGFLELSSTVPYRYVRTDLQLTSPEITLIDRKPAIRGHVHMGSAGVQTAHLPLSDINVTFRPAVVEVPQSHEHTEIGGASKSTPPDRSVGESMTRPPYDSNYESDNRVKAILGTILVFSGKPASQLAQVDEALQKLDRIKASTKQKRKALKKQRKLLLASQPK